MKRKKTPRARPEAMAPRRVVRSTPRLLVPLLMLVVLCACESGSRGAAALPECTAYASTARLCLGGRVADRILASFAKPPEDASRRAQMSAQCRQGDERLRLSCR